MDLLRGGAATGTQNWRGVYPRLADVPTLKPEFGDGLIAEMAAATRSAQAAARTGLKPYLWHEALALVAGLTASPQHGLRVLDFGGGLGTGYLQLATSLPPDVRMDYHIVDNAQMCAAGRALFSGDPRIRFSTSLPTPGTEAPDIVYANSVLQYIEDYAGQLRALAAFGAPQLLLGRLAAGACPTFATQQVNVPGQLLPYWFLNVAEVTEILAGAGYRLVCDELTERTYDQSNLPATHRVEKFRNMLFVAAPASRPASSDARA